MITVSGPSGQFKQPKSTEMKTNNRVVENNEQIQRIAELISGLTEVTPLNYLASSLPPLNHPVTIDFFFVTTLQQFSFWTIKDGRYHRPLIDTIGGEKLKGAFYLFKAYNGKIDTDPGFFSAERQANQTLDEMLELFRSDDGNDVMPVVEMHLDATHRYGKTMLELGWNPKSILKTATESDRPLQTFLAALDHVGGYCEDPMRKKSVLLAEIFNDLPEMAEPDCSACNADPACAHLIELFQPVIRTDYY
jgi:hypothetical protein